MVVHLPLREQHDGWAASAVTDGVKLGVQFALGAPDDGEQPLLSRLAAVR